MANASANNAAHNHKRSLKYESDGNFAWENNNNDQAKIYESTSIAFDNRQKSNLETLGETFYGKTLNWYLKIALFPGLLLLAGGIIWRLLFDKYLYLNEGVLFEAVYYAIAIAAFICLTLLAVKKYQTQKTQIAFLNIMFGVICGFLLALFELIWYFKVWTIINLIGQPILFGALGWLTAWLIRPLIFKNKKN